MADATEIDLPTAPERVLDHRHGLIANRLSGSVSEVSIRPEVLAAFLA